MISLRASTVSHELQMLTANSFPRSWLPVRNPSMTSSAYVWKNLAVAKRKGIAFPHYSYAKTVVGLLRLFAVSQQ